MSRDFINIPLKLMKEVKNDALLLDLLCLSISIKKMSGASKYYFKNIKQFSTDFGLNGRKAVMLFNQAKCNKRFFEFDEKKNVLIAKTFKKERTICRRKKGKILFQMYCMKLKDDQIFKIGKIKNELRMLMILCAVNACFRMDKFDFGVSLPCHTGGVAFSQKHLSNIAGVSRKTVVKYLKQLEKRGQLEVYKGKLSEVVRVVDKPVILEAKRKHKYVMPTSQGYGCVYYMTMYRIADRSVNDLFGNIIYGCKKRHTHNEPENNDAYEAYRERQEH